MSDTRATSYDPGLGMRLKALFDWWKRELWGMVPGTLKQSAYPVEDLLLASFQEDSVTFFEHGAGQWRELGKTLARSTLAEVRSQIPGISWEKKTRIARLPADEILHRSIELPLAAEQDLGKILSYQLDTVSPYPPDQIYHAHRILERDLEKGILRIELFLAPRELVDRVVARMREWNLAPDFVDCAVEEDLTDPVINLLPGPISAAGKVKRLSRFNTMLLLINLLLLTALAMTHLLEKGEIEQELRSLVESARIEAEAANVLREKVNRLQQQNSFLLDMKKQRVPALQVIDELSRILPDDTWLEGAVYSGNEINLSGISSKSSTLISKIERSPLFEEAAFQASVVQDFRSGGERFQIRAAITAPSEHVE